MDFLRKNSATRQLAAFAALYGLVVQLIVAAFSVPAVFAAGVPGAATDGLRTIVICTSSGYKRITFDAQGNPVDEQDEPASLAHCKACHAAGGFCLPGSATPDFSTPSYAPFRSAVSDRQLVVEGVCPLCPESRGPPLLI